MATIPLSGTNIRLLSNVPFTNDYKNTRWFDTISLQTNYFTSKNIVHNMLDANFQRIEGASFIRVNKSIDQLWGTNYLMFQNAQYNNKWFYGFVTKIEYVQKNTTNVHFQIDVLQTWRFEMNFKPSFVSREHCKLWEVDGSPVINTIDEGLNYGSDYDNVSIENYVPYNDIYYLVVVSKALMHGTTNEIKASVNGMPQPLCYYIQPFRMDGTSPNAYLNGSYTLTPITTMLTAMAKLDDAVNNIVSMYVTDYIGYSPAYNSVSDVLTFDTDKFEGAGFSDNVSGNIQTLYVKEIKSYTAKAHDFGDKYNGYESVSESKLLMHPYTVLILDDFKGNRVEFKNEYIDITNLNITVKGSLGTSNKVSYGIKHYLSSEILNINDKEILTLENALINNNPNDVSILSDYLSAYLQGNKNSLEHQKTAAIFNGATSAVGNVVGGVGSAVNGNPVGVASSVVGVTQGLGSSVLKIQGIEKKKMDVNNTPPSMVKMGSNTAFDYGNGYKGIYIIKKQVKPEYRKKLTDFFNMFGYKINEVKIPNFHTRQYWNYIETTSCTIIGNLNNEDLQELKSIFDSGITLWHTDDIANYELTNGVI